MVQKIHPQAGHLSEKNDDLAVQYEDYPCLESLDGKLLRQRVTRIRGILDCIQ